MLRPRAIRSLLVEEVASLRVAGPPAGGDLEGAEERDRLRQDAEREALERAEHRALRVVGLDWAALVVLFLLRDPAAVFLPMDATVDTVFTLGVVVVAVHSGFRLAERGKYRAVRRAWEELTD
ncbi:MAG: hypothetical protein ACLF0P_15470 [Thermoanaerobaculia bacterium]